MKNVSQIDSGRSIINASMLSRRMPRERPERHSCRVVKEASEDGFGGARGGNKPLPGGHLSDKAPLKHFGRGPRHFDEGNDTQRDAKVEHPNLVQVRSSLKKPSQSRVMPEGISPLPTSDDTTLLSDSLNVISRRVSGSLP
jgi:hypothetical protein